MIVRLTMLCLWLRAGSFVMVRAHDSTPPLPDIITIAADTMVAETETIVAETIAATTAAVVDAAAKTNPPTEGTPLSSSNELRATEAEGVRAAASPIPEEGEAEEDTIIITAFRSWRNGRVAPVPLGPLKLEWFDRDVISSANADHDDDDDDDDGDAIPKDETRINKTIARRLGDWPTSSPGPSTRCSGDVNVCFALDASGSVTPPGWVQTIYYAKFLIAELDNVTNGVGQYSAVEFNDTATISSNLTDKSSLDLILDSLAYVGGQTNQHDALNKCQDTLIGANVAEQPKKARIIILVTDGLPTIEQDGTANRTCGKPCRDHVISVAHRINQNGTRILPVFVVPNPAETEIEYMKKLSSDGTVLKNLTFDRLTTTVTNLVGDIINCKTTRPSIAASQTPSSSDWPTSIPSSQLSTPPSMNPSVSSMPSGQPSENPSASDWPKSQPSELPSGRPSSPPTGKPSSLSNPTNSPTNSQGPGEQFRAVVCGRGFDCTEGDGYFDIVEMNSSQEVRCCRDCVSDGPCSSSWKQKCGDYDPEVYARSKKRGKCYVEDFCSAMDVCADVFGGRLCTPEEVLESCAKGTGCRYDKEMVWACMYEGGRCQLDEECCSGKCGGEGVCLFAEPGMCS